MGGIAFQLMNELMHIGHQMDTFAPFKCTDTYFVSRNSPVCDDLFHYDNWCTTYDCAWSLYYMAWFWICQDWVAVFKINIYLDNCGCSEPVTSLTGMGIICEILTFLSEFGVVNSRFGATHRTFWR